MTDTNILPRLAEVCRDVFENDGLEIARDMSAEDVEEWDSVQHIRLILAVEEVFDIRFTTSEVVDLQVVGDLVDSISRKLKG